MLVANRNAKTGIITVSQRTARYGLKAGEINLPTRAASIIEGRDLPATFTKGDDGYRSLAGYVTRGLRAAEPVTVGA